MAAMKLIAYIYVLFVVFGEVFTKTVIGDVGEIFDVLLERIELLEASDAANKAKIIEMESEFKMKQIENEREISNLKSSMNEMKANFKLKESEMLDQINELKTKEIHSCSDGDSRVKPAADQDKKIEESRKRRGIRKYREVPETEVAFYATHTDHDVLHLGNAQILQFQDVVTNIGSAFNQNAGIFVAPVDGTYVFHATIMGVDIHTSGHYSAHFDINGTVYSKFWVTAYDQSSQMLIIPLHAGDTVSVKNDHIDEGFVGQHFSSFSGFLLYQNYSTGVIVGK